MSTNLYWEPVKPEKRRHLGYYLKFAVAPRLWNHDGSLSSDKAVLTSEHIPWLQGIADASGKEVKEEARKLIKLIQEHEEGVLVWLQG